jgi:uncharacterized protein (DUF4415 family)
MAAVLPKRSRRSKTDGAYRHRTANRCDRNLLRLNLTGPRWRDPRAWARGQRRRIATRDAPLTTATCTTSMARTCSTRRRSRGSCGLVDREVDACSWSRIHSGEVAMPKRSGSSARGGRAVASGRRTRRQIDFCDIPDSSAERLKAMRRVGRPPLGDEPRQLIAIRVDAGVLEQFRKEARRRRVGYQTLMNEVLARHARKDVA